MPIKVTDAKLIAELEDMRNRGQAYVGAFLQRNASESSSSSSSSSSKTLDGEDDDIFSSLAKKTRTTTTMGPDGAEEEVEELDEFDVDPASDMHDVGTFAQVHNIVRIPNDTDSGEEAATLLLLGHRRLRKLGTMKRDPMVVKVEHLKDEKFDPNDDIIKATTNEVVATIKDLLKTNPLHKETLQYFAQNFNDFQDPPKLADLGASMCSADDAQLQNVLELLSVQARLDATLELLKKEVEIGKLQADIGKKVEEKISGDQRRYFLMEQLKSIKKELGMERDDKTALIEKFSKRFEPKRASVPEETAKVIDEELQKLSGLEPSSSEFNVTRNYLEWLTSLPWGVCGDEKLDIGHAQDVLDADHYGLEDVKDRILEFIAVGQLLGTTQGKIITMVGPPGVGKTSIGQSIAKALGRKFYRFSVGGMSDVAEIKGHRRTYVGAMPGKLIQCLKSTGVCNPVVLIDEIDKLGRGYQGDPASALLELLDPEQNGTFLDHYLDVPVDLSKVLFVCTANVLDTIPGPLLDRMEVVRLSGYITDEKVQIARTYLEKAAKEKSGLKDFNATITDEAMAKLIGDYCREAGVRNLQKHLEKIYRKVALKVARAKSGGETLDSVSVGLDDLIDYVGHAPFATDKIYDVTPPGVVTGLAWTAMGGSTLYIECTSVDAGEGKGALKTTGQLGDVMKESSTIAHTFARHFLETKDAGNDFLSKTSLHMHVPAGATPKDGPSAGITITTSLLSLAMGKPVKPNLAMTGELTLTGRVLPVGGIKEKTIAARRSGVTTIIFPEGNKKDYDELSEDVREGLEVHFVSEYNQVYEHALDWAQK
jgi:Lon-like ATP-dependent protease